MSEPWDPQPPVDTTPFGPQAELYTATYQLADGTMRREPIFANSDQEAFRWAIGYEKEPGERLISVERGGTLPPIRR